MKIESAHDVFWLARYAHNTIDPLIKAAQQYDPSISLNVGMDFAHDKSPFTKEFSVAVTAHWERPLMFLQSYGLTTTAQIDRVAATVQEFIDAEQAKIEERHDLEVFYGVEEARQAEEDAAWELQQDRIRERADIERAEHDHDIELQNIAAGN